MLRRLRLPLNALGILLFCAVYAAPVVAECNSAPQTLADDVSTLDSQTAFIDPLANDFDAEGQPLSLQYLGDTCLGSVAVETDVLTYTPLIGVAETCNISYQAVDSEGASAPSTIAVTVRLFQPSIFSDGFEMGNTSNWSTTVVD